MEDTMSKHTPARNNLETMLLLRLQCFQRLYVLTLNNAELMRQAEESVDMVSDYSVLKDHARAELVRAKLLMRKRYPVRFWFGVALSVIKQTPQLLYSALIGAWRVIIYPIYH